jgi:hypothetical protein
MKKLLILIALLALCTPTVFAQSGQQQSFNMSVVAAPPTTVAGQSTSSSAGTAVNTNLTGGTVAAGTYRVCVTYFSSSNTETPCSTDTAATSVITTTGSTSTVVVSSPVAAAAPPSAVGYRIYVGASGGASAAETLQTINSTVCVLSTSSTPSCAIGQPATFTSSAGFTSGSGGPASPGTFLTIPIANAANLPLFENSLIFSHIVQWTVTGTAPGACTFSLQTGSTVAGLANVGQAITCTASGTYAVPYVTANTYSAINVSAFTAGGTNTSVTFTEYVFPYILPFYWGNAAPTSACSAGMGEYINTAATSVWYYCAAGTWTVVTLP